MRQKAAPPFCKPGYVQRSPKRLRYEKRFNACSRVIRVSGERSKPENKPSKFEILLASLSGSIPGLGKEAIRLVESYKKLNTTERLPVVIPSGVEESLTGPRSFTHL